MWTFWTVGGACACVCACACACTIRAFNGKKKYYERDNAMPMFAEQANSTERSGGAHKVGDGVPVAEGELLRVHWKEKG